MWVLATLEKARMTLHNTSYQDFLILEVTKKKKQDFKRTRGKEREPKITRKYELVLYASSSRGYGYGQCLVTVT